MKQLLKYTLLIAAICLFTIPESMAQAGTYYTVRDLETWTSAQFNLKVNKKLEFSLSEQLRLKDNSSTIDVYFTQLGVKYKVAKGLSFGIAARFIKENDNEGAIQGYESHLRWNTDIGYKHDIDRFTMKYRLRYQNKNELGVASSESKKVMRFKLGTSYNIKNWKLDPDLSAEIFNPLGSEDGLSKFRATLGTDYKTKNAGSFGAFYRMEKELTGIYPKTTNIIGLKYEYTLKYKKNEE